MNSRTARNVAAIASLSLLGATVACTNFYEVPIETPIQAKLDVGAFRRVLVAGFISGGTDDVDANMETVRLLRSQLRTKTNLRVIEAEVLPLVELAEEQALKAGEMPIPAVAEVSGVQPTPQRPQDPPPVCGDRPVRGAVHCGLGRCPVPTGRLPQCWVSAMLPQLRPLTARGDPPGRPGTVLRKAVSLEVAFALVVLGVTSVLVATQPAVSG